MALPISKLTPDTPLPGSDGMTIAEFWAWAYSDVLSNGNRSVFAEFLVAAALGITTLPRREWDMVDLHYQGKKIEVKSSGYVQSWAPTAQSSIIRFDIAEKLPWDGETNTYGESQVRSADCYVFCLYLGRDRAQAVSGVLDTRNWHFYVVATDAIARHFGGQKSIGLRALEAVCTDGPVRYEALQERINTCLIDPT